MKEKILNFIDKALDEALKIAMSFAAGVSVTSVLTLANIQLSSLTSTLIFIGMLPTTYITMTVLKKKYDEAKTREYHQYYQLNKSMNEAFSFDNEKTISKDTTMFFSKIDEKKGSIELDRESLDAINQFLYMINENYYDIITEKYPALSREALIDIIVGAIVKYLIKYDQDFFDDIDVDEVLRSLFIIDEKLRKRIVKEFKESKTKVKGGYEYRIISKNVTDEMLDDCLNGEEVVTKANIKTAQIDLDNPHTYEYLISVLAHDEANNYGDFSRLPWNIEFLQKTLKIMTNIFGLVIKRERGSFDEYELAVSFIFNVGIYASLNNRKEVNEYEVIQTFKEWDYLSRETKEMIVDYLFETLELDSAMYPYQKIKNYKQPRYIIPLPSNRDDNN